MVGGAGRAALAATERLGDLGQDMAVDRTGIREIRALDRIDPPAAAAHAFKTFEQIGRVRVLQHHSLHAQGLCFDQRGIVGGPADRLVVLIERALQGLADGLHGPPSPREDGRAIGAGALAATATAR